MNGKWMGDFPVRRMNEISRTEMNERKRDDDNGELYEF